MYAVTDWKGQMSLCIDCLLAFYRLHLQPLRGFFFSLLLSFFLHQTQYSGAFHLGQWNYFSKIINSQGKIYPLWVYPLIFFFRCLHNLRSDLCLDSKRLGLCRGGRRKLPSEPVWPARANGRTRNYQIKYRWAVAEMRRSLEGIKSTSMTPSPPTDHCPLQ